MAEEKKNNSPPSAKSAMAAVKAAGKAAAGDVAGAVVDVLKDEQLRNMIIVAVLAFSFIVLLLSMSIGSALTGAIEELAREWEKNWDKNWEAQGVTSNGSIFYMYTTGFDSAVSQTVIDTLLGLFNNDGGNYANHQADGGGAEFTQADYENTINSIKDLEALAGQNGALRKRLEMIKGRVRQRGQQILTQATNQYALDAIGIAIAAGLSETIHHPFLYNGVDYENSTVSVDILAFLISDIQALKILAAYCIQHECDLAEAGMWELMNYCGWYLADYTNSTLELSRDSIYAGQSEAVFGSDFFGVLNDGNQLDETVYVLDPPTIVHWTGSYAPQWYYEQKKQIKDYKAKYDQAVASGDAEALKTMYPLKTTESGEIDYSAFSKLNSFQPYGLIDKLFVSSNATLTVSRTDYHGADACIDEALAYLGDLLISSVTGYDDWSDMVSDLMGQWTTASNQTPMYGTTIYGDVRYKYGGTDSSIMISQYGNNPVEAVFKGEEDKLYAIREYNTDTWQFISTYIDPNGVVGRQATGLKVDTYYQIYEMIPKQVGESIEYEYEYYNLINTFFSEQPLTGRQAYQLQLRLDITFASRSIDDLTLELIGLWPGDLKDTVAGSNGKEYAFGHDGNKALLANWTDTFTDANGVSRTMDFKRMYGYQYESYNDYIRGVAALLDISTVGIFTPDNGYGDTIVSIAKREAEYYRLNSLATGKRYWDALEGSGLVPVSASLRSRDWSAAFVWSCAYQCGYIGPNKCFGEFNARYLDTDIFFERIAFSLNNTMQTDSNYAPQAGDLIFFAEAVGHPEPDRVGIVIEVNEAGFIRVVEGDYNDKLIQSRYTDYAVGTRYETDTGEACVISCYVRPQYPESKIMDPMYIDYPGTNNMVLADRYARLTYVGGEYTAFLAGYGRVRASKIKDYVTALKEQYPDHWTAALQTAANQEDYEAIISEWYNIFLGTSNETAKRIQLDIFSQICVRPIVSRQLQETGFDWTSTKYREEVLLALVSSSSNEYAVNTLLKTIREGLPNNASDEAFLLALMTDDRLCSLMESMKTELFYGDPEELQQEWCNAMRFLLNDLRELYLGT